MDVIARCAFGLHIESLGNPDDPFVANAQRASHPPAHNSPFVMIRSMYPNVFNFLVGRFFVTKQMRFFVELLQGIVRERSASSQKYNDFIEAATEAIGDIKKEDSTNEPMWTKEQVEEIVMGQSSLFLLAAFDTTATTLASACFFLARNPHVQEKLYDAISARHQEFVSYNQYILYVKKIAEYNGKLFNLRSKCLTKWWRTFLTWTSLSMRFFGCIRRPLGSTEKLLRTSL